jgi:single-stranded DNA-binding protein
MASGTIAGRVTGKTGEPVVSLRDNGNFQAATFSVLDNEYAWFKNKEDNPGQFWRCEVTGKQAQIVSDRLQRGDKVSVTGQLVIRQWNDKKMVDIKNARVTFLEDKREESESSSDPF